MKKIVCDLCGESDFVKANGFFECQVCGAKYTVAEARNMFVEVNSDGTITKPAEPVKVEEPAKLEEKELIETKKETSSEDENLEDFEDVDYVEEVDDDEETPVVKPTIATTPKSRAPKGDSIYNNPLPTSVSKQTGVSAASGDLSAVKRIVSTVKKNTQSRNEEIEAKPKPVVKRVVVKAMPAVKKAEPEKKEEPKVVKPQAKKQSGVSIETSQLIQNYFILAQSAYDSLNYVDAESYANKIIELEPNNPDAWLLKGNCAGYQTHSPIFRLLESINCWNTCIQNSSLKEREDYIFTARTNCIEVSIKYALRQAEAFKKNPSYEEFDTIKASVDYLEPMLRKANQTFGIDIALYQDKLASNINAIVEDIYKNALVKFGKRKETQTEANFLNLKEKTDLCVEVWNYLIDLAKKHGTVTSMLKNVIKGHENIMRSQAYRQTGNGKFKELGKISMSERNIRLDKINKVKYKVEDKFADIRKHDRASQVVKNAKYWEEHQEEKQILLDERNQLDHEVFELENAKLKMPELKDLKKLEEESVRFTVLKDNPTYSNKERTQFLNELNQVKKIIVTKKRELASIINPIDEKIEKMKKRIFTIDAELNQNR